MEPEKSENNSSPQEPDGSAAETRRRVLRKLGRFAAVSAPVVTLVLAAGLKPKAAAAAS
jgi:hypothetical protein